MLFVFNLQLMEINKLKVVSHLFFSFDLVFLFTNSILE
jgi:hypothetical protein